MEKFKALWAKGDKAFKNEEYLQAISFYSDALLLSPKDENVLGCRSAVYAKLGMFNDSKKDAESLISVIPQKPKGHFLRAAALENLGNYRECLRSYLKAYELDTAHPTELLLRIIQAVGCICQMSETEELSLAHEDVDSHKFERFVQVGKRLYETGNYKICIDVISTALKAHYRQDMDQLMYSEASEDNLRKISTLEQVTDEPASSRHHVADDELQSSGLPDPVTGFSSIYYATGDRGNDENIEGDIKEVHKSSQDKRTAMMSLLFISESYYSLFQYREALSVARRCLSMALDLKDKEYEIKCYVKLANVYHRLAQYTQAVSYNGKLLAVGRDLQNNDESMEGRLEYWTSDLERRAVWNLCAAYKLMGNYEKALEHAQEYMEVVKFIDQENLTTAYSNLGELELLQGNYEKSLECHKIELQLCKKFDDRQGAAYAYGNIGTVYAYMGNFKSAAINHEQHLKLAQRLNDKVSELIAVRNFGCLHKLMGEFTKAVSYFEQHLQLVKVNKLDELLCKAYSLLGACYRELHQLHHSQYYYETCLKLAVEQNDLEEELECQLALAEITKAMRNFETSRQHFNKAIPVLEEKLLSKQGKSLTYKDPLLTKLEQCYKDLQEVLIEMNFEGEALEIVEHVRSRILVNIVRHTNILADCVASPARQVVPYSADDIINIVNNQKASVLFFSVVPSGFLLWMLSPGKGIVKCHWHKDCDHCTFANKIKSCIEELHGGCQESYNCDHRALLDEATKTQLETKNTDKTKKSCYSCEFLYSSKLTPLQKLYHLLLSPVEEELKTTDTDELVVIPDQEVNSVPFPCLQDQEGQYMHEVFSVRILPCIRLISQQEKTSEESPNAGQDSPKILVQGNPEISTVELNDKIWRPTKETGLAEEELNTIASLLGVDPVSGCLATKEHLLKTLPEASVVHLVTYGSWSDACVAMSPEPHHPSNPPTAESFLVTVSDIALLKLSAKLIVLNACCGCDHQYCQLKHASFHLAMAFLAAGVQSVVMPLWSVPQDALLNLFHKFYSSLEMGKTVSDSLKEAWTQVKDVEHMSSPSFWASFVHVGFDTAVDLIKLRHQLFDKELDRVVQSSSPERFPLVTSEILDNKVPSVTFKMKRFQELLTQLLLHHGSFPHVLPAIRDVVQLAHQMLLSYQHPELLLTESFTMCAQLSSSALEAPDANEFLGFLGFDFQKDGARDKEPFVVFPHWDPDGFLAMSSQVLQAVCDILKISSSGGYALAKVLQTLKKNTMEKLKEFLNLSCRYPERIMKTSDFVLRSLWFNPELQRYLASLGFYEVGQSLLFNKTEANQILLKSSLLIISTMLDYIERGKLRTLSSSRESRSTDRRSTKLISLSPQLTPSKQIVMKIPWMSRRADNNEDELKMALSRDLEGINKEFAGHVTRSNYWHAELLRAQSSPGTKLPIIGGKNPNKSSEKARPDEKKAGKVKVQGGMTASCNRRPVEEEPRLSINDTRERRNEIYRIYAQRFDDIAMHKRYKVRQLFMSQISDST